MKETTICRSEEFLVIICPHCGKQAILIEDDGGESRIPECGGKMICSFCKKAFLVMPFEELESALR